MTRIVRGSRFSIPDESRYGPQPVPPEFLNAHFCPVWSAIPSRRPEARSKSGTETLRDIADNRQPAAFRRADLSCRAPIQRLGRCIHAEPARLAGVSGIHPL